MNVLPASPPDISADIITSHLDVSATAIICFDFLLTFSQEVQFIWKRPRSLISILFLAVRYLPLLDICMTFILNFAPDASSRLCFVAYNVRGWPLILGLLLAEGILIIRTVAVWGNSRRILILLLTLFVAMIPLIFYCAIRFLGSASFAVNPPPMENPAIPNSGPLASGCFLTGSNDTGDKLQFTAFVVLLAYETLVFIIAMSRAAYLRQWGVKRSALYKAIFRDGLVFYVYLFVASLINIVVLIETPKIGFVYVTSHYRALHVVFAERIILNIRAADARLSKSFVLPLDLGSRYRSGIESAERQVSLDVPQFRNQEISFDEEFEGDMLMPEQNSNGNE